MVPRRIPSCQNGLHQPITGNLIASFVQTVVSTPEIEAKVYNDWPDLARHLGVSYSERNMFRLRLMLDLLGLAELLENILKNWVARCKARATMFTLYSILEQCRWNNLADKLRQLFSRHEATASQTSVHFKCPQPEVVQFLSPTNKNMILIIRTECVKLECSRICQTTPSCRLVDAEELWNCRADCKQKFIPLVVFSKNDLETKLEFAKGYATKCILIGPSVKKHATKSLLMRSSQ